MVNELQAAGRRRGYCGVNGVDMNIGGATDGLVLELVKLPRILRKTLVVSLDLTICVASAVLAYTLRIGELEVLSRPILVFTLIAVLTWIVISISTNTYRSVIRFSGYHTLASLMRSSAAMGVVLTAILVVIRIPGVPRTLAVIYPLVLFIALAGQRLLLADLIVTAVRNPRSAVQRKRVLIFGSGWAGQQLSTSIRQDRSMKLIGFVDANESLRNETLEGKPIWHTSDLELVLAAESIDQVFIALPSATRSMRRSIVDRIRRTNGRVAVLILPTLGQIASGSVSVSDLREVQIEELLGRDEVPPRVDLMSKNITAQCVLVTGAGGSIGSELCRQIVRQRPRAMILVDQSEYGLYRIDSELRDILKRDDLRIAISSYLVDIKDERACRRLFEAARPETVFHAAAYKHVPLVEENPESGIHNNVFGTLHTCLAAEQCGTRNFILVSTDKAVRPTNIMGTSKRICELIAQARASIQKDTRYTIVRFGNVLGSSGSVVPRFREQIAVGGPITVTDRGTTRYFMTISEAAQLVIQAGALAKDGEVLLLDMGKAVRIVDLARMMVQLSGLTVADEEHPDGDIAIVEIGLRPGEKLVEELLLEDSAEPTVHPRILKARERMLAWDEIEQRLHELKGALDAEDSAMLVRLMKNIVPEYQPRMQANRGWRYEIRANSLQSAND